MLRGVGGVKGVVLAEAGGLAAERGGGGDGADAKRETPNSKPTETSLALNEIEIVLLVRGVRAGAGVALVSAGLANLAMARRTSRRAWGTCERAAETRRGRCRRLRERQNAVKPSK